MIVAFVLSLSMMSSLVACGSFELASIVVVNNSIATEYYVGDTVSFDGIKIKAKFNDGSEEELKLSDVKVLLNDEDITSNLSKITETKGDKAVVISYENQKATITIKVTERPVTPGPGEPSEPETVGEILGYGLSASYSGYETQTKEAGTLAYGEQGFEAQFTTGDENAKDFVVGDDNVFRFIPRLRYEDYSDAELKLASTFASVTTIKYENETLETKDGTETNTVEYYLDDVLMVTAYTLKNEYQFTQNAIGKQFELSVLPVDDYFDWGITKSAVTITVNVVDGYNIYNAYQLAVIDNSQSQWNDIKETYSLTGIDPKSVVFQNDIIVTTADIPAAFTYTLDKEVKYLDRNDQIVIGSSTFLYDGVDIVRRDVYDGTSLDIYGNYFTLDLQQLPLVSSFSNEKEPEGYGFDGSNTTFFAFRGNYTNSANFGLVSFNDLAVSGNANIDPLKNHADNSSNPDEAGNPVYCGGIVLAKTSYIGATYDNFNVHKTFIPFFPDDVSYYTDQVQEYSIVIKNSKAFDSLNSAVFAFGRTKLDIINSVMERAGGPLILAQVSQPETYGALRAPIITVDDDSILNNPVTGNEFWFVSKGANAIVSKLAPLDYIFGNFGRKIFNNDSKLNLICAIMPSGGVETVTLWQTQGYFSYKGTALDRIYTDQVNHMFGAATAGILATAAGQTTNPKEPVIGMTFNAGSSFGYMADATTPAFAIPVNETTSIPVDTTDFALSDYIALNYGGFGLFLQFYPAA